MTDDEGLAGPEELFAPELEFGVARRELRLLPPLVDDLTERAAS